MDTLKTMTDEMLVNLYATGNNRAFEVLLLRHKNKVYSYIFNLVRDRDLCEDIFQETFIRVVTCIRGESYTESGKFLAWVTRIAHNLAMDNLRLKQNNDTVSADNNETNLLNDISLCEKNIEDDLITKQIYADLNRLIDALPKNQREIIRMRYYEDLSFKEISDKTGVSINTSLGRMRYAILNMRKLAEENNVILSL